MTVMNKIKSHCKYFYRFHFTKCVKNQIRIYLQIVNHFFMNARKKAVELSENDTSDKTDEKNDKDCCFRKQNG